MSKNKRFQNYDFVGNNFVGPVERIISQKFPSTGLEDKQSHYKSSLLEVVGI
jgi:hypothetical protein